MHLSVIIPCYNEEKRLGKTLDRVIAYLSEQSYTWEILVVDNGSKDRTGQIVGEYSKKNPNVRLLLKKSHGKGWAVKEGMIAAQGHYRLFMDADNSTDIGEVAKLLPYATDEGYDVVISSRKAPGAVIAHPQPKYRVFLGNMFAGLVRLIVPIGVKDTQNGFKLFSRKAAERIFPHQTTYYWSFDVELLALAKIFGYKIKEVPIVWVDDDRSHLNFKGMAQSLFEVILIRIRLSTHKYVK